MVAIEVHIAHCGARLVEEHPPCEEYTVVTEQRSGSNHPRSFRVQEPCWGLGVGGWGVGVRVSGSGFGFGFGFGLSLSCALYGLGFGFGFGAKRALEGGRGECGHEQVESARPKL